MSAYQPQRTFVLQLTPKRGVDPIRALRALLKIARRKYQLRCTSIEEIKPPEQSIRSLIMATVARNGRRGEPTRCSASPTCCWSRRICELRLRHP